MGLVSTYYDATLRSPALSPLPTGPVPHLLAKTLLGGGLGYLAGKGYQHVMCDPDDPDSCRSASIPRNWALMGAGAGAVSSIPDLMTSHSMAEKGEIPTVDPQHPYGAWFDNYPWTKKSEHTAVLVTGNPKYIANNKAADKFYAAIESVLKSKGYSVSRDPGADETMPQAADLWVGHSRGAGRFKFAPEGQKYLAFGSKMPGAINNPKDDAMDKDDEPGPAHYKLTAKMRAALGKQSDFNTFGNVPWPGGGNLDADLHAGTAMGTILQDNDLDPIQKAIGITIINNANKDKQTGYFGTGDLIRGAVQVGLGYTEGVVAGKVLGAVFGLPDPYQKALAGAGAVGGLLKAVGVFR